MVDFDGVVGVTEAIGGVDVCVAEDVLDEYSGLDLIAGEHSIAGTDALAFLRTRHGLADGSELGCISAQQTFMASPARKVKSAGTLANPVALFSLADAASRSISVDDGIANVQALAGLAGTLANVDLQKMILLEPPVEAYDYDPNSVQPNLDLTELVFASLREDRLLVLPGVPAPDPSTDSSPETDALPTQGTVELPEGLTGQTADRPTCAS